MQPIRRKIKLVIFLLIAAAAVSYLIYARGRLGFNADGYGECGTVIDYVDEPPLTTAEKDGKLIFQANCAACHSMEKEATGPALLGAADRAPYPNFIKSLLFDPEKTLKKSSYAIELFKKYGKIPHTNFREVLSDKDVQDIIAYISRKPTYRY